VLFFHPRDEIDGSELDQNEGDRTSGVDLLNAECQTKGETKKDAAFHHHPSPVGMLR
jgi:hypothetical protein